MNLHDVNRGIHKHKKRKRVGRGTGSGHGKTARPRPQGPGPVGRLDRAPGVRRRPDAADPPHPQARLQQPLGADGRGASTSATSTRLFDAGDEVTPESLKRTDLAKGRYDVLKVLGDGELTKKLKVSAHRFSKSALEKIKKPGGEAIVLPGPAPVVKREARSREAEEGQSAVSAIRAYGSRHRSGLTAAPVRGQRRGST